MGNRYSFDNLVGIMQDSTLTEITPHQHDIFKEKYKFDPTFEYGRDANGNYIIRTTKENFRELEFYFALKYDREASSIYLEATVEKETYVVVAYDKNAAYLGELFTFLEENK